MTDTRPEPAADRVELDGKFFRLGGRRFAVRGVSYGGFAPNAAGEPFPEPARAQADFELMRTLGANVVRTYEPPPRWLLDLALAAGLRVFTDLAWPAHRCFLDTATDRRAARQAALDAVRRVAGHPALFAVSLANEIPPDVVRWSGPRRVRRFLDDLVPRVRELDPAMLVTFASFPPTEYLQPEAPDFVTFNVYLHDPAVLAAYLARLQMIADTRPLLLGECGADARREGEARQAEIVAGAVRAAFRAGLAGAVVFQFTDDWHRGGGPVLDWEMGLTTRVRTPRPAYFAVQRAFAAAGPPAPPAPVPLVSVVVACRNGERTLRACLASLERLRYPAREVILVDDGSTDATPEIAKEFPAARYFRQPPQGLSVARNVGIGAARGEIVAFTDADCRVDEDWLDYLVADLLVGPWAGIGGHNLLPPDDSPVAAAVMASPGGPAHVMLDDRRAEHLPGCNMAFRRAALLEIGGFDAQFTRAGDDVDVCWRLLDRGYALAFSPGGFVWHHRRPSVRGYLRQQAGYGEAEALLVRKHPEYFNALGGMLWRGRIYSPGGLGGRPIIYHGRFGAGMFQSLYTTGAAGVVPLLTSLEYWLCVALPLLVGSRFLPGLAWPAWMAVLAPLGAAAIAGTRARLPAGRRRWWSRPLVAAMFLAQPVARGAARYFGLFQAGLGEPGRRRLDSEARLQARGPLRERAWWSPAWRDRLAWIGHLSGALRQAGWDHRADAGWGDHDLEVLGDLWTRVQVTTVAEANQDASQTLRARLRARWTLLGAGLFWGLLVALLVALGTLPFAAGWPGWLIAALLLGATVAFLRHRARRHLAEVGVVLDEASAAWGLRQLPAAAPPAAAQTAAEPSEPPA